MSWGVDSAIWTDLATGLLKHWYFWEISRKSGYLIYIGYIWFISDFSFQRKHPIKTWNVPNYIKMAKTQVLNILSWVLSDKRPTDIALAFQISQTKQMWKSKKQLLETTCWNYSQLLLAQSMRFKTIKSIIQNNLI